MGNYLHECVGSGARRVIAESAGTGLALACGLESSQLPCNEGKGEGELAFAGRSEEINLGVKYWRGVRDKHALHTKAATLIHHYAILPLFSPPALRSGLLSSFLVDNSLIIGLPSC